MRNLMGSFGPNGSVPWLKDTEGALYALFVKRIQKIPITFFLDCPQFKTILTLYGVTCN